MFYKYFGNGISRTAGKVADITLPTSLRPFILGQFARSFNINCDEAEYPLTDYKSFNDFFTRGLKHDARLIDKTASLVSPVDGKVLEYAPIEEGTLIQAKGLDYRLEDLVPTKDAESFKNGQFMTIYLAPSDCHRIFSPIDGMVKKAISVPGHGYPVREPYISEFKNLYTLNERLVTVMDTAIGKVAMVMVAATNVANVSAQYDRSLRTNLKGSKKVKVFNYNQPFKKGQWINTFHLGSTVILLTESRDYSFTIDKGTHITYGTGMTSKIKTCSTDKPNQSCSCC